MKQRPLIVASQFGIVVITILIALFKLPFIPPQIPLFYSLPAGAGRVVDSYMLLLIPFCVVVFLLFNRFVLGRLCADNEFVMTTLSIVNYASVLICALICIKILFLVT